MNSEPTGSVNPFGDQLLAVGNDALPIAKPPVGKVLPSEQTAQAELCAPTAKATTEASSVCRQLRLNGGLVRPLPPTVMKVVCCNLVIALYPAELVGCEGNGEASRAQLGVVLPLSYRNINL
jgi:hypothetical protein